MNLDDIFTELCGSIRLAIFISETKSNRTVVLNLSFYYILPNWFGFDDFLKINRTKPNFMHFYLTIMMIFMFKIELNRTANTHNGTPI
jgi:hypothetical protein